MDRRSCRGAAGLSLFVFAKEPVAGQVKTRLVPPLSPAQAARCHRAFVSDTITSLGQAIEGAELALAVAPQGPKPWLAGLAAEHGLEMVEQGQGDLGARMAGVLATATAAGGTCVLIGADTPDLPPQYLRDAFARLQRASVVLGPAADGGYYLIGARALVPPVFDLDAQWGGAAVLAETKARLRRAGLSCALLAPWRDVDRYDDLEALALRLRTGETQAPATAVVLAELTVEGLAL